jgi:hypothetical protein
VNNPRRIFHFTLLCMEQRACGKHFVLLNFVACDPRLSTETWGQAMCGAIRTCPLSIAFCSRRIVVSMSSVLVLKPLPAVPAPASPHRIIHYELQHSGVLGDKIPVHFTIEEILCIPPPTPKALQSLAISRSKLLVTICALHTLILPPSPATPDPAHALCITGHEPQR